MADRRGTDRVGEFADSRMAGSTCPIAGFAWTTAAVPRKDPDPCRSWQQTSFQRRVRLKKCASQRPSTQSKSVRSTISPSISRRTWVRQRLCRRVGLAHWALTRQQSIQRRSHGFCQLPHRLLYRCDHRWTARCRRARGCFPSAGSGGMPASASGGTYILEATANLSDGRVLKLNATVQCKLPGS